MRGFRSKSLLSSIPSSDDLSGSKRTHSVPEGTDFVFSRAKTLESITRSITTSDSTYPEPLLPFPLKSLNVAEISNKRETRTSTRSVHLILGRLDLGLKLAVDLLRTDVFKVVLVLHVGLPIIRTHLWRSIAHVVGLGQPGPPSSPNDCPTVALDVDLRILSKSWLEIREADLWSVSDIKSVLQDCESVVCLGSENNISIEKSLINAPSKQKISHLQPAVASVSSSYWRKDSGVSSKSVNSSVQINGQPPVQPAGSGISCGSQTNSGLHPSSATKTTSWKWALLEALQQVETERSRGPIHFIELSHVAALASWSADELKVHGQIETTLQGMQWRRKMKRRKYDDRTQTAREASPESIFLNGTKNDPYINGDRREATFFVESPTGKIPHSENMVSLLKGTFKNGDQLPDDDDNAFDYFKKKRREAQNWHNKILAGSNNEGVNGLNELKEICFGDSSSPEDYLNPDSPFFKNCFYDGIRRSQSAASVSSSGCDDHCSINMDLRYSTTKIMTEDNNKVQDRDKKTRKDDCLHWTVIKICSLFEDFVVNWRNGFLWGPLPTEAQDIKVSWTSLRLAVRIIVWAILNPQKCIFKSVDVSCSGGPRSTSEVISMLQNEMIALSKPFRKLKLKYVGINPSLTPEANSLALSVSSLLVAKAPSSVNEYLNSNSSASTPRQPWVSSRFFLFNSSPIGQSTVANSSRPQRNSSMSPDAHSSLMSQPVMPATPSSLTGRTRLFGTSTVVRAPGYDPSLWRKSTTPFGDDDEDNLQPAVDGSVEDDVTISIARPTSARRLQPSAMNEFSEADLQASENDGRWVERSLAQTSEGKSGICLRVRGRMSLEEAVHQFAVSSAEKIRSGAPQEKSGRCNVM